MLPKFDVCKSGGIKANCCKSSSSNERIFKESLILSHSENSDELKSAAKMQFA